MKLYSKEVVIGAVEHVISKNNDQYSTWNVCLCDYSTVIQHLNLDQAQYFTLKNNNEANEVVELFVDKGLKTQKVDNPTEKKAVMIFRNDKSGGNNTASAMDSLGKNITLKTYLRI